MVYPMPPYGNGDGARLLVKARSPSTIRKDGIKQTFAGTETILELRLLRVDEVADLLRTTKKGIYAMVARRQIPGTVRIGRRVLFRGSDLMRWLDGLTDKPG
jgi:excisionase family DNA binding protein